MSVSPSTKIKYESTEAAILDNSDRINSVLTKVGELVKQYLKKE